MKFTRSHLFACAIAALVVFSFSSIVSAAGFKLPAYDPKTEPYKTAPWIDGTHYFHDISQKYIEKYGHHSQQVAAKLKRAPKAVGQKEEFYVMNIETNQPEKRPAILRKISAHCYLYVEEGKEFKDEALQKITDRFDNTIYKIDTETFGSEPKPGIDRDERITILMVDVKDGWAPGKGYVGGYFFPLDCYSTNIFQYSNEREMVYLDCYPSDPESPFYLGVIAHEFQHMIHFNNDPKEGKWLNEGCAQLAFYACGYDHPSQILSYIANPASSASTWSNSVVDYGAVYLFHYYLFQKYAGKTFEDKQKFYRDLVASPTKESASIDEILKKYGVDKKFDEIFRDWAVANLVNNPALDRGQYGYDKTLTMKVHLTDPISELPAKIEKRELPTHGCANIMFSPFVTHLPETPTLIEKFKVFSKGPGAVLWGVNGWKTPADKYIPQGSTATPEGVATPLSGPDAKGLYSAEFGPFVGAGLVDDFNFKYKSADGTLSAEKKIDIIGPTGRGRARSDEKTALVVEFAGEKPSIVSKNKKFRLIEIVEDAGGALAVSDVPLKDNQAKIVVPGYGKSISKVYFIAYPESDKALKFDLSASAATAAEAEAMTDAFVMTPQWLVLGGQSGPSINDNGGFTPTPAEAPSSIQERGRRSDSEDTSHSNFGYLVWKMNDNVHLLTHLKIDPGLIEGQLLQLYKTLQITMNLPNLPIPDGFAIKDYDCKKVVDWAAGLTDVNGTTRDRDAIRRVINVSPVLENFYNQSLLLTEDMFESIWKMVSFTYRSINIMHNIAGGLANVPVVGTLAQKAKYKIIAKLIESLNSGAVLIAPHLPPKIGPFFPTAVWVLSSVYCGIAHVQLETNSEGTKEFVVKLLGKYLLASLPKIGFVDRSQKSVDAMTEYAMTSAFTSDIDTCINMVANKKAHVERLCAEARATAAKDRQIANFTGALAQLAAYASVVDPTVISKVAGIALGVTTGGFYVHSIYVPAKEYLKLDDEMKAAVELQMTGAEPAPAAAHKLESKYKFTSDAVSAGLEKYLAACDALSAEIEKPATQRSNKNCARAYEEVLYLDDALNAEINTAKARASAVTSIRNESEIFDTAARFDAFAMAQVAFYGDALSAMAGKPSNLRTAGNALRSQARLLAGALRNFEGRAISAVCSIESISYPMEVRAGQDFTARVRVKNVSAAYAEFSLSVRTPKFIESAVAARVVRLAPGESKVVAIELKAGEPLYDFHESAMMFCLEAENVIGNSKVAYIAVKK